VTDERLAKFAQILQTLPTDHRHYWIGTFYTLLLPKEQRRHQSAYFTRPEIARHLLRLLEDQGTDFTKARVLDPAAGGAAFLSMVAARMKELGCTTRNILSRIKGIEIDPKLAELARLLVADRLGVAKVPKSTVVVGDALKVRLTKKFDLVLANPPYGRVSPDKLRNEDWSMVCHPGHINLYALFIDLCLRRTKTGGRIGFVIPSSFIAGPLYCKLRSSIRQRSHVKLIGHVECREEFFLDVMQDISLLILHRKAQARPTQPALSNSVAFGRVDASGQWNASPPFNLPDKESDGWVLPSAKGTSRGGATLSDYGCKVSAGYFVWNRETGRMRKKILQRGLWVPLFWACNIRANVRCWPNAKDGKGTDYVRFDEESPAILRGRAILLQRTTNTKQSRRLIAGLVEPDVSLSKGYVSENHTIVVRPLDANTDLQLVCRLLNSASVDRRYRQISGTASISTLLLRDLDLPSPESLRAALAKSNDFEEAVERAYTLGDSKKWTAAS
jgi:adenine-specific DNA-methyltransferase